ncbi:putative alcohol dehydrogenase [Trichocladium antarcticum]|uniref:Alcohol dehydrogenase n=1 Tax=Trichocladium antarcticum TaxID=1450529 RepID=A0AAN6UMR7_9PEZI|nr:putative alcohol dehydrogenase [Trichocladium antarcticum]
MSLEANTKFINKYVATKKGGPFELVQGPYPEPDSDEICIRNRAVALNPIDLKCLHQNVKAQAWPAILGVDVSGVVEAVGKDVKDFKVGDPVLSLAGFGGRAGGFQDVTTVPAHFACRKPEGWTFEQAASVPPKIDSVLVLGGASGVGACTLQLLRAVLPDATIISTNSLAHNDSVKMKLGATTCVDRRLPLDLLVARIRALTGGKGVDAIVDAVGLTAKIGPEESRRIFGVLRDGGPRIYTTVVTGARPEKVTVPEGVKSKSIMGRMAFLGPHGDKVMSRLGEFVEEGWFGLPLKVEIVGSGLKAIEGGLEQLANGVSGTKLVVGL